MGAGKESKGMEWWLSLPVAFMQCCCQIPRGQGQKLDHRDFLAAVARWGPATPGPWLVPTESTGRILGGWYYWLLTPC